MSEATTPPLMEQPKRRPARWWRAAVAFLAMTGRHWGGDIPANLPVLQKANARTIPELGIDLIWIPSPADKAEPFWLGRTEVTQAQWAALMGSNASEFKGQDLPVEKVNWMDAMEFCRKLTDRERTAGRLPPNHELSLPSDEQWEFACRAGTTGDWPGDIDLMAWYFVNSGGKTHPVGTKQPNAWELYDMLGNVAEWCLNGVSPYPALGPDFTQHSVRGGSWRIAASQSSSRFRIFYAARDRQNTVGFRVALSASAAVKRASTPIQIPQPKPSLEQPPNDPMKLAKDDLVKLTNGLVAYHITYGRLPEGNSAAVCKALAGENKRREVFVEWNRAFIALDGSFLDQWGSPYSISFPDAESVEVRSAGPDKALNTADDQFNRRRP